MKKRISKRKVVFCLDPKIIEYLKENFENKSRYIEYLIYRDLKDNNLIKKEILLYE